MPPSRSRHPSAADEFGGTLLGFIIGLVVGLAIAVAVAIYITNAPLPFVTKVKPPTVGTVPGDGKTLPDPNRGLTPAPSKPAPPATTPAPVAKVEPPKLDSKAAPPADAKAAAKEEPVPEGTRFLLQAGAFKTPEDADSMRARLALIGLDAKVYPAEQGGQALHRVRLGPYAQLDDVNRVRKLLADNGIEGQIVRVR